ncbi:hypothetical protein COCMIDRAFT_108738, partial [Bipolaris oryzae ATCC 44560]
ARLGWVANLLTTHRHGFAKGEGGRGEGTRGGGAGSALSLTRHGRSLFSA